VEVLVDENGRRAALHDATFRSLHETPKQVPLVWLYDERGSRLFDEITRLPEYYLTGSERELLVAHAADIASFNRAETLVELGSGTSDKTRLLLDALATEGSLRRFVPLDVSEEVLVSSAYAVAEEYPAIEVHAVVGDFERHLSAVPGGDRHLLAFLGSTIGNLPPDTRGRLLDSVAGTLGLGDALLLGLDLVKDPARIEAAYNDSHGLTERFVRNALFVLDRELGSDFSRARFYFAAFWDPESEWMDIGFNSVGAQIVRVPSLGVDVSFVDGERLRVEVSTKFRRDRFEAELEVAGLSLERWWTDAEGDFALCLAVRARS